MLKSNIPIASIRFFGKTAVAADFENRFSRFLRGFREQKWVAEDGPDETCDLYGNSLSSSPACPH